MTNIYEKGTIKIVWLERDTDEIYSQMFEEVEEAREFARGKRDYLIFSLVKQKDMKTFTWKLLPFGRYKLYKQIMKFRGLLL